MPYFPNQQCLLPHFSLTQIYKHLKTIGGGSFGDACNEVDSTQETEVVWLCMNVIIMRSKVIAVIASWFCSKVHSARWLSF